MQIVETEQFREARHNLPQRVQKLLRAKLDLLQEGSPAYPSLRSHRCRNLDGFWWCYIGRRHRLLYRYVEQEDTLALERVGTHAIVDRIRKKETRI